MIAQGAGRVGVGSLGVAAQAVDARSGQEDFRESRAESGRAFAREDSRT